MTYVKSLDGLRAVAVLVVVFAHSEWPYPRSGGVAVDVFFVLSGFLITSLIVSDLRRNCFSFGAFYARRMLRLAPCLVVTCFAVAALQVWKGLSVPWQPITMAMTYTVNWATAVFHIDCKPLSHCWSLANEEQYYLIWPMCVVALERRSMHDLQNALFLVAVALLCAGYRFVMVGTYDAVRINFALDTRLDGLMMGSSLAYFYRMVVDRQGLSERLSKLLGYVLSPTAGLILLWIMFRWHWTEARMGQIGFLLVSVSAVVFIADLVFGRHSIFRPLLSVTPLTYVGKISYGIYLLHLFVFDLVDILLPTDWLPRKILIKVVGSVLIASVSFHLLESPFLRLKRRFQTVSPGAAALKLPLPAAAIQDGQP
jgi:peptidoglycan/LPS O-acetylase OafA/YrhL